MEITLVLITTDRIYIQKTGGSDMGDFRVNHHKLKGIAENLQSIQSQLKKIESGIKIEGAIEAAEEIRHSLDKIKKDFETDTMTVAKASSALRQISDQYIKTEKAIQMGRVVPPEIAEIIAATQVLIAAIISQIGRIIAGMFNGNGAYDGDPVDMTSGNFVDAVTELTIYGPCNLNMTRFYNAKYHNYCSMGIGWSHNYEVSLETGENEILVCWGDQSKELFISCGEDVYMSKAGSYDVIVRTEDGFLFKRNSPDIWEFNFSGELVKLNRGPGRGSLEFTHDEGKLLNVKDSYGNYLEYSYTDTGLLCSVTDNTGRTVLFDYDHGCLSTVTAADGLKTKYQYNDAGLISAVIGPDETVKLRNEYDEEYRVIRQILADGGEARYEYTENTIKFTDRNDAVTTYVHDENGRIAETRYPAGTERFEYNDKNERILYVDPEGNEFRRKYDESGNVTEYTDALGCTSRFTYDDANHLIRTESPERGIVASVYDENDNEIETTDSLGNKTQYKYNNGLLTEVINPDGGKISYSYDDKGRISRACDAVGSVVMYEYDDAGRITRTTDGNGAETCMFYDNADRVTGVINAIGQKRTYEYKFGNLVKVKDFDGYEETWTYNQMGLVSSYTDKCGRVTRHEHDKLGNVKKAILPDGAIFEYDYDDMNRLSEVRGPEGTSYRYTYNANGNLVSEYENGHQKTYVYDAMDRITCISDSFGPETRFTYDKAGRLLSSVDENGEISEYCYDTEGRKIRSRFPGGLEYTYKYDSMGRLLFRTDSMYDEVTYHYYPDGSLKRAEWKNGGTLDKEYDINGNLIREKRADGYELTHTYDALDQMIKTADNSGRSISMAYDAAGNLIRTTDALGHTTDYRYSPSGQVIYMKDACGNETRYAYDKRDRLRMILKGNMADSAAEEIFAHPDKYQTAENKSVRLTRWERDLNGNVTERIDALGNRSAWIYDEAGNLSRYTNANNDPTDYLYEHGMLRRKIYADNNEAEYCYDRSGRIAEIKDWTGTVSMSYDSYGRLTSFRNAEKQTFDYKMDPAGRRTELVYPDGTKVLYTYNSNGQTEKLCTAGMESSYGYDSSGRIITRNIRSERNEQKTVLAEKLLYTDGGKIGMLEQYENGNLLMESSFGYDDKGNMTSAVRSICSGKTDKVTETYTYEYDEMNRIRKAVNAENPADYEEYRYDEYGNCVFKVINGITCEYEYNVLDQLTSKKEYSENSEPEITSYTYDSDGHLIMASGAEETLRTYDVRGNLTGISKNGKTLSINVNSLGRVLSETDDAGNTRQFRYDMEHKSNPVLGINDGSGWKNYVRDSKLIGYVDKNESEIYLCDEKGSVLNRLKASESEAASSGCVKYDVYGNIKPSSTANIDGFGYTGLYLNQLTGTYRTATREYDPMAGRFLSRDDDRFIQVRRPATLNQYQYCYSNPIIWVDPDGTDCYIFYKDDTRELTFTQRQQLADLYGYDISKVHMVRLTDNEQFVSDWNGMGTVNGETVSIDTVIIHSHANPYVISDNANFRMDVSDINQLDTKSMENLVLEGCNAGHLDHASENVANAFAKKVDGAPVLASDGTVRRWMGDDGRSWHEPISDKHFRSENHWYHYFRKAKGWVVYQEKDGAVTTTEVGRKKMNATDMVKTLRKYPKRRGHSFTGGGAGRSF